MIFVLIYFNNIVMTNVFKTLKLIKNEKVYFSNHCIYYYSYYCLYSRQLV